MCFFYHPNCFPHSSFVFVVVSPAHVFLTFSDWFAPMPLPNAVIQGYTVAKIPERPLAHFYGRTPLSIDTLWHWVKFPHRYDNLRLAVCFWTFMISAHFANKKQRQLKAEWEKNMQIQKKLHPAGMWDEELAVAAAEKLGRPKPGHPMRVFEDGYQQFDLKPKLFDPDEAHH